MMARKQAATLSLLASALLPFIAQGSQVQTADPHGLYAKPGQTLALTHATLITAPGKKLSDATLVIKDGVIVSVGNKVPNGARVIDTQGAWIYPGFIDPYSNYGLPSKAYEASDDDAPHYSWQRAGAQAHNAAIHGSEMWRSVATADKDAAKIYLDDGFTSVESARLDGIFRGYSVSLSLAQLPSNQLIYKDTGRQFMAFDKGSSPQEYPTSLMGAIALVRQTLSDAAWYKEAQSHNGARRKLEANTDLAALANLPSQGILMATRHEDELLEAAQLFNRFGLTPVYVGSNFEYDRADAVAKVAKTVVLPLNFPKPPKVTTEADLERVQLADLRHWERAPTTAAELSKRHVAVAFSRHGVEGSMWPQIKKALQAGLSEDNALAALTTVPAEISGISQLAGQLKAGMMADFVVASGNLFEQGHILSTWTQGQPHSQVPINLAALWGSYTLANDYSLSIDPKGEVVLKKGDEPLESLSSRYQDNHLELRFVDGNTSHYWQLSGSHKTPKLSAFQSGQWQTLSINPLAADSSGKAPEKTQIVSRVTFPNQAYGLGSHPKAEKLLIKNATVWTSEKAGILKNTDVLIANGKIDKIGNKLSAPRGAQVIDATGMHLTAGIIDEHSHIAISGGVNEASEAVTSEVRIEDVINPNDISIYRALAGGTTSAQLLHGSANPIGGQSKVVKLRWGETADDMKFKRAPGTIKFALGENVKQSNWGDSFTIRYPQSRMGVKTLMEDAFQTAKEYQEQRTRYDLLSRRQKREVLPPRRDFRLDALVEVMNKERFVHAHSYVASEILALMEVADDFDFHIQTFTHILEGYKVADEMKAHGTTASTFADWWAYKFEVYDAIPENACLMNKKGLITSINSDSEELIRRLNLEAAKSMAYCGMSPEDAWKMATINPAKQLKVDQYTGSIKEGKDADLVLWDANPLSAKARVQDTWVDGKRYFDRKHDLAERQAIKTEKAALIAKVLKSGEKPAEDREGYRPTVVHWHCEDMDNHLEAM
ncbi:amidohydrolase family protein [Gallaecimonas mangrovi]|uniref:amidohydrolase family protein n=1 Tax=Gallaecimonas mangrovi TaxID=2291597 RepID=UPI000E20639F|nr:amidohydrolase family protein [Gallaecimonas mangrovi]